MIIEFIKTHFLAIAIIALLAVMFYLAFFITSLSIKQLKVSIFSAYPFDLFFPSEKGWSAGFFLIVIIALAIFIYVIARGNFIIGGPA